jgi:hypothetical protein
VIERTTCCAAIDMNSWASNIHKRTTSSHLRYGTSSQKRHPKLLRNTKTKPKKQEQRIIMALKLMTNFRFVQPSSHCYNLMINSPSPLRPSNLHFASSRFVPRYFVLNPTSTWTSHLFLLSFSRSHWGSKLQSWDGAYFIVANRTAYAWKEGRGTDPSQ